ncbi:MAG: hypothetical protein ACRDHL_05670 [Candidatus Promineifilaceae bacterium]
MVEYALLLALIAVAVILILAVLGPQVGNLFSQIAPCAQPAVWFCAA